MLRLPVLVASLYLSGVSQAACPPVGHLGGPLGFGDDSLARVDDGFDAVNLSGVFPDGLVFFDTTPNSAFVNTNGTISFAGPYTAFDPASFPQGEPLVAPFFADVDNREEPADPDRNLIYWHRDTDPLDGTPRRFIVTRGDVPGRTALRVCELDLEPLVAGLRGPRPEVPW